MNEQERIEIRKIINKITNSSISNKETHFSDEYPQFKKKYPGLFDMACNDKLNKQNLEYMLSMLEKMENEKMSQYDASAQVGTMLYQKYVEPNLPAKQN
jgi:hypothetical protein